MTFLIFWRDHLRSTSGIICDSGSFAVQFGDHFRSGDHLRSGIICGAVHIQLQKVQTGRLKWAPTSRRTEYVKIRRAENQSRWPENFIIDTIMPFIIRQCNRKVGNLWQSSEMFGNVRERLSAIRTTFEESLEIIGKCSEIFGKPSKKSLLVCL